MRCLASSDREVRSSACWALGELQAKEAADCLEELLDDVDSSVRWFALGGLHKISRVHKSAAKAPRPAEPEPQKLRTYSVPEDLDSALNSEDSFTRAYGLRTLFSRNPNHPLIHETISDLTERLGGQDTTARSWAALSLSMLGESAMPALAEAVADPDPS